MALESIRTSEIPLVLQCSMSLIGVLGPFIGVLGVIYWCTCLRNSVGVKFMTNTSNSYMGIHAREVFNVILGSLGVLVCKWTVIRKGLVVE